MSDVLDGTTQWDRELARRLNIDIYDATRSHLMYLMEYMKHGNLNVGILYVIFANVSRALPARNPLNTVTTVHAIRR